MAHGGARAGAGRDPVIAGEETVQVTVRLAESHVAFLEGLVRRGYAPDRSAAIRRAIEDAQEVWLKAEIERIASASVEARRGR